MPIGAWRLLALPCLLGALFLVGSPEFPALARAVATLFTAGAPATLAVADTAVAPVLDTAASATSPEQLPAQGAAPSPSRSSVAAREGRGALVPLYLSFAALQALDVHSTLSAVNRGARETNPMMAGLVDKPLAFVALKAAISAGIIYLTERVRVRNRVGSIVLMTAFNSLYATIVANNYRVAGQTAR